MKNIFKIIVVAVFAMSLLCSCTENVKTDSTKLNIVVTGFAQYDFVRQLAGSGADITMLIQPGSEVHTYEPTPKDIMALSECDLFVYNGGVSDTWVSKVLESAGNKQMKLVRFMDVCKLETEQLTEGMEAHEHRRHYHEQSPDFYEGYDEHVWTSTENARLIANEICAKLSECQPENKENFEDINKAFQDKLTSLDEDFQSMIQSAKRKTVVVGDRFPFLYLAKQYGIEYFAAFPGCASNTEPSADTVMFLSDKVKNENLPVVFAVDFSNGKIANSVAEKNNAEVLKLYSCHNVTKEQFDNGETYISLMRQNLENLRKALN